MTGPRSAFVLGAGLGKRLRPLTDRLPKPLIPVFGKPLISFAFDHLREVGVRSLVVNTHHCPEEYPARFGSAEPSYLGTPIAFSHEPVLLETGGGIRNALDLIGNDHFAVYNGDVLTDVALHPVWHRHLVEGNIATLILRSSGGPLEIQCESDGKIVDIGRRVTRSKAPAYLFSGVYFLHPSFFDHILDHSIVSVIPILIDWIRRGARVRGVVVDQGKWADLGSRDAYLKIHREIAAGYRPAYPVPAPWPQFVDPAAVVDPGAVLTGFNSVGPGVKIAAGAQLEDCVFWGDAEVASGVTLKRCIVRPGSKIDADATDCDF